MKYDFDTTIERRKTHSYKWDSATAYDLLPMWVADMDFRTAPAIVEALHRRVQHGIFGYTKVPDAYYDAVISWFNRRHGWMMQKQWIIYTTGVVPALSAIIRALTSPGDKVLVQSPVYNCFFSSISNNSCEPISNDLLYINNSYVFDFEDLSHKSADPSVKVLLLCNPHNPTGRVWSKEELTTIGNICLQNNVFVVADEIHCDLVYPGYTYTPFASICDDFLRNSATCTSPSKAFNLAGLQIANITIADKQVRQRVERAININEVCDVNPFGVDALIAAYNCGQEWLGELVPYLYSNYCFAKAFFNDNLPHIHLTKPEGTYLLWVDCSALGKRSEEIAQQLLNQHKVWINQGALYGENGDNFVRINIACPRDILKEGLERMLSYFDDERLK